jgi:predicted RNA-binding Zn-ribbon protein involved in translation (DUF1610 family)
VIERALRCLNCDYGKPLACPRCPEVVLTSDGEIVETAGYRVLKRPGIRADTCPNCRTRLVAVARKPRGYGEPFPCTSCGRLLVPA